MTLDQRSPERPATEAAPTASLSEAVADSTITVTGIVRSVLRRPWASGADILAVVADGTGEVTVVFDGVGPLHLTAGVWVTASGLIRSAPTGWTMHEPELRAADRDVAPR